MTTEKKTKVKKQIERKLRTVEHFTVSYDATDEEYAHHKINARNLVKVVQDMIDLVERRDKLLNGKQKTVELYVQAPNGNAIVKEGSIAFPFAMEIFDYICTVKDVVTTIDTKDVIAALGISIPTGAVSYGVFKDILLTKGEPVIDVKTQDGSDKVEVLTENTKVTTTKETAILMQDDQIRQAIKKLTVTPLANKKDAVFKIQRTEKVENTDGKVEVQEQTTVKIESLKEIDTLTRLSETIAQEPEKKTEPEAMIMITQLNFYSGKTGWKMRYDGKERAVELQDEAFIEEINANQASFRKGDWLKVKLDIVKTFGNSTKTSYIITEVLEHLVTKDRQLVKNEDE